MPPLHRINPIPGMINDDESRFLHWIARNHVSDDSHIDVRGGLAGGSIHSMCSGLALNTCAVGHSRVHSYDLWRFYPAWSSFFPGANLRLGDDIHPHFRKNLGDFQNIIVTHPGDVLQHRWTGEPIEVLFIDAAKSPDVWLHMLREFVPHCMPGHTLLLHQD